MSLLKFTKMQSLGNDFMVVDGTKNGFVPNQKQLKKWSDRNFGIGFDQFLLVENSIKPECDFKYRIFNADGSEVEMCGNGARCFLKFVLDSNLTNKQIMPVETIKRQILLAKNDDGFYETNVGSPNFYPKNIPTKSMVEKDFYELDFDGEKLQFQAVSMGNPHAVLTVSDVENYPVEKVGKFIQNSGFFTEGVNVNFMQIINNGEILLRTFERGVGETLACGSGACASVACGIKTKKLSKNDGKNFDIHTIVSGGELQIRKNIKSGVVLMVGDAHTVYEGTIQI